MVLLPSSLGTRRIGAGVEGYGVGGRRHRPPIKSVSEFDLLKVANRERKREGKEERGKQMY